MCSLRSILCVLEAEILSFLESSPIVCLTGVFSLISAFGRLFPLGGFLSVPMVLLECLGEVLKKLDLSTDL